LPMVLGLVHVAMVAPHYFVGSFDDDASYILSAKAILSGSGRLVSGASLWSLYAPGYGALIAPLVWLSPHHYLDLRLFSATCFAAVFPLTWVYLRRKRVDPLVRLTALVVMALGPPFATYGSMVMAETAYLVLMLVLVMVFERWVSQSATWTPAGLGAVAAAGGLIWLKEAGLGFVGGMVLWLAWQQRRRGQGLAKAVAMAGGVALMLLPVVVARLLGGIALAGNRYSAELGVFYQGGLVDRLSHVLPHSARQLFSTAIPATVVPYLAPLPINHHWPDLWKALSWQVTLFALVGAVVWYRRHHDVLVPAVSLYLFESVLWPYVNERRAILILPFLVGWYALGLVSTWRWLAPRVRSLPGRVSLRAAGATLAAGVVVVPLVLQMPRDYLFGWKQSSSRIGGSDYARLLSQLGNPSEVVETDYRSAVALYSGHRTNWSAFLASQPPICYLPGVQAKLAADDASYLLLGNLNKPGVMDNRCLLSLALTEPWADELLHSDRDNAYVFELVGPGTGHPDLVDLTQGLSPTVAYDKSSVALSWDWGTSTPVHQVSISGAVLQGQRVAHVSLELETSPGQWRSVASAQEGVGQSPGQVPYLLARLPGGTSARAIRLVLTPQGPLDGLGAGQPVYADLAVLGVGPGPG